MDLTKLDELTDRRCGRKGMLIPLLQEIQSEIGYLPPEALRAVAEKLSLPLTQVYSVATFYKSFSLKPRGRHIATVCLGTACHVRGGAEIADEVSKHLGVEPGGTTPDGEFTFETARCLGVCALGPILVIDGRYFSKVTPESVRGILQDAAAGRLSEAWGPEAEEGLLHGTGPKPSDPAEAELCLAICDGPGCSAAGSGAVAAAIRRVIRENGLSDRVALRLTGCLGLCESSPVVLTLPDEVFYQGVTPQDASDIVLSLVEGRGPVERLLYVDHHTGKSIAHQKDIPFYAAQDRRLLSRNTRVCPSDIGDYLATGGYAAARKALLEMSPEAVIEEVKRSQLRGRGGAGFPTGLKWDLCRRSTGNGRVVICNADEGDPGAYMDRGVLEGNPHSVLEGMLIGAYAMGASRGLIYVRAEYPLAVRNAKLAVQCAQERGFLGKDILGSGFDFELAITTGAGAFVCGEETALIASLQDRPGEPRPRPPFPAQEGVWGQPTNINNVETWANVPLIIERGGEWFASVGTENSRGTKIFSLVGKVRNTGLVEVPMGMSLRELVFDIGGGPPPGRKLKAVQTGGPSGGCIPAQLLDLPVDYDSLTQAGAIMGSGGLIVMDDRTCMVDLAKYFLGFLGEESCGKCVPCREGIPRMLDILNRISDGEGREGDQELLERLGRTMKNASLCGLGQTAANPVLSSLLYFTEEYETHIRHKSCPAAVCMKKARGRAGPSVPWGPMKPRM